MDSDYLTLTANTVGTITLARRYRMIEVTSDGAAEVFFTVNGSTPSIRGRGTIWLPALPQAVEVQPATVGATVVKFISAGTPKLAVRGW